MPDDFLEIIYLFEFVLIVIVRKAQTSRYRKLSVAIDRKSWPDLILLTVSGIAMLLPLVYLFSDWLDFAHYRLPQWPGWIGAVLFAAAIWLLWRSHADLGLNWTPTLGIRAEDTLVTDGVFRYIRHPMYAAHILWGIATALMLPNWIAGYALLLATLVQYLSRVQTEEQMMIEQFGQQYREYRQKTGRIFPRIFRID